MSDPATSAMDTLTARMQARNSARLIDHLRQSVPLHLNVPAENVEVTMSEDGTTIGIAAMLSDGSAASTSAVKPETMADLKQWTEARCVELETQITEAQESAHGTRMVR